ncbi:hypothetical protein SAMN05660748_2271 [Blastococcus aggregatus]|uniref:Uncharacterized protein n=1 Tax=Blastococcus aggregatus TaxID=38502 RepID=A0A285V699_9ACTN|nr:hypothetical protein [Blastococcus aggregatus]SOC49543.1 hypothetical protein SAMN05660748_2271 [Blastococcus aggregatus]
MSITAQAIEPRREPAPTAPRDRAVVPVQRDQGSVDPVDAQLATLEARLLGEVEGNAMASMQVRFHLAAARRRFADARIREFLPILVEREVRRGMRTGAQPR